MHSEELGLLVKVMNSGIMTGSKGRQWPVDPFVSSFIASIAFLRQGGADSFKFLRLRIGFFWGEAIFVSLERCNSFCPRQSSDVLFGALVDASGQAELHGITDHSIDFDLGLYEPISIPEAFTPNLLIAQDPLVSLLRALIASV